MMILDVSGEKSSKWIAYLEGLRKIYKKNFKIKRTMFWDVTLCSSAYGYQCYQWFRGAYCNHLQSTRW
jgi:hypothetical protein